MSKSNLSAFDGSSVVVYSTDNTYKGTVAMDGNAIKLSSTGSKILIDNNHDFLFKGLSANIGGLNTCALNVGRAGDTINLNVSGVTYNLGTVHGNIVVNGSLALNSGKLRFSCYSSNRDILQAYGGTSTGLDIVLDSGRTMIVGSGESGNTTSSNITAQKTLFLTSDESIQFITNLQNGWASRKEASLDALGNLLTSGKINGATITGGTWTAEKSSFLNQSVTTTSTPTFTGIKITSLSGPSDINVLSSLNLKKNIKSNGTTIFTPDSASFQNLETVSCKEITGCSRIESTSSSVLKLNSDSLYVNKNGQLESKVTDIPPFLVSSKVTVPYLSAGLLDGKDIDAIAEPIAIATGCGVIKGVEDPCTVTAAETAAAVHISSGDIFYRGQIGNVKAVTISLKGAKPEKPRWDWIFIPTESYEREGSAEKYVALQPAKIEGVDGGGVPDFPSYIKNPVVLALVKVDNESSVSSNNVFHMRVYPAIQYDRSSESIKIFEHDNGIYNNRKPGEEASYQDDESLRSTKTMCEITNSGDLNLMGDLKLRGKISTSGSGKLVDLSNWDSISENAHKHVFGYVPEGAINNENTQFYIKKDGVPVSLDPSNIVVYKNGLRQLLGDDYSVNNATIAFTKAPQTGDTIVIDYIQMIT